MEVRAFKNVDIEFEATIDLEDFINEFVARCDEPDMPRRLLAGLDCITRAMERIPIDVIEGYRDEHRDIICSRLIDVAGKFCTTAGRTPDEELDNLIDALPDE